MIEQLGGSGRFGGGVGGLVLLLVLVFSLPITTRGFAVKGDAFLLGNGPFAIGTTRLRCAHVPTPC